MHLNHMYRYVGLYVRSQSPVWQRAKGPGPTSPGREIPKTNSTRIAQGKEKTEGYLAALHYQK